MKSQPNYFLVVLAVDFVMVVNTFTVLFKLWLGALIPMSVGLLVCPLVCLSSKNYKKNYKTLQSITKQQAQLGVYNTRKYKLS